MRKRNQIRGPNLIFFSVDLIVFDSSLLRKAVRASDGRAARPKALFPGPQLNARTPIDVRHRTQQKHKPTPQHATFLLRQLTTDYTEEGQAAFFSALSAKQVVLPLEVMDVQRTPSGSVPQKTKTRETSPVDHFL